jgi:hypothetical protein
MEIGTLGDAWERGVTAWMACAHGKREGLKTKRECMYRCELDMETLVCTRGRDFPLVKLGQCLRCLRCGSREVRVVFRFPGDRDTKTAAAGYRFSR